MIKFVRVCAGLLLACGVASGASAQTSWDMPTPYPDGNFHTRNAAQFAADVDKATNGSLKISRSTPQARCSNIRKSSVRCGRARRRWAKSCNRSRATRSPSMRRIPCRFWPRAMTPRPRSSMTCRSRICRSNSSRKA